jgi:hypothetical protein
MMQIAEESSYEHGLGAFLPTRNAPGTPRDGERKKKKVLVPLLSTALMAIAAILGVVSDRSLKSPRPTPSRFPPLERAGKARLH